MTCFHVAAKTSQEYSMIYQYRKNVYGPMENESISGSDYFVFFKDDNSRSSNIFFLNISLELQNVLERFLLKKQSHHQKL